MRLKEDHLLLPLPPSSRSSTRFNPLPSVPPFGTGATVRAKRTWDKPSANSRGIPPRIPCCSSRSWPNTPHLQHDVPPRSTLASSTPFSMGGTNFFQGTISFPMHWQTPRDLPSLGDFWSGPPTLPIFFAWTTNRNTTILAGHWSISFPIHHRCLGR